MLWPDWPDTTARTYLRHALNNLRTVLGDRKLSAPFLLTHLQGKRCLLVLDNFDHVLDAAPLVTDLLTYCHHLKILVTSREVLRVRGERVYQVLPLARRYSRNPGQSD